MKNTAFTLTKRALRAALLVLLAIMAGTANAQTTFAVDNLNYSVNSDWQSVTVTGHVDGTNASGELSIPDSVLYQGNNYLVTAIGESAFNDCWLLTGSLIIPNSVTTIGSSAFQNCFGFNGSLIIGNSVTSIGDAAFYGLDFIDSIWIYASTPPVLGNEVFGDWSTDTPVHVPCGAGTAYSTISWGEFNAFTEVCFEESDLKYSINEDLASVTVTGHVDGTSASGSLTIPESVNYGGTTYTVTAIGDEAFKGCTGFTGSLIIPNSVTTIGNFAFYGCNGFTGSLTLGNAVTVIGKDAFNCCTGFNGSLIIPNSVTTIGEYAFYACNSFSGSLIIPDAVTTIGGYAFFGCSGFTGSLIIPNSVTTIEDDAFMDCGFTGSLIIPNSVTVIGKDAFYGCTGFSGSLVIPDNVTTIGEMAFYGCSGFTGSLTLGNSVTTIGNDAFYGCSGFTGSLVIPDNVTTIGERAFFGCTGFNGTLTLGNAVTTIGENAFDYCTGFTGSLVIPNNVTMIGSWAFMDCTHFSSVYAYATTPPGLGYGVFVGWATTTPVYVPCGAGTAYSTISWGEFDAFTEVCFDDGVLTYSFNSDGQSVTVTGHVDGQNASGYLTIPESVNYLGTEYTVTAIGESAFESCAGFDGSLSIPDAVTTIGSNAFKSCTGFTGSLTLGSSLTTIGDHAFHDCVGFSGSLNLPNTVTSIGDHAFHGCSSFTGDLTLGDAVTTIGESAFNACNGFNGSLTLGSSVTVIGDYAFYCCSSFTGDLTLPNSVTTIGANAFYYCYGFNGSLTIGDAVETIGDHAFWNCYNLSGNLTLPSTLTSIGNYTFYQCYSFSGSLTLPDSVEKIGDYAFCFCVNLSGSLTFPSTVDTIGEYAFYFCTNLGSIWMLGTTPPSSVGNNAFAECSSNLKIYVPCGAGEAYSSISWGGFNEFRETCPPFSIVPDTLDLGHRPAGKWMRPFQFTLTNDDSEAQITGLQLSGTALSLEMGDLTVPFTMYENDSITLGLAWGNQPASVNDTLTVSFTNADGAGSLAFPVFAEVYTPALGDVWENPKVVDGFPYNETLNALSIPLYDNYMLPNPDTLDGNDVVYRLVFDQETMLSAHVTAGANGKVAFYDEDFNGLGGPDEKNVFGNSDPFEAEIGEGGNYTYYFPFYTLYIHSIAESLFLASELDSAGVTTSPMTSLSWYCNYASGYPQHGLSIWMANVTDMELDTVSHVATDMTLVYTGDMTPAIGWNEFVFNEDTFAWDGVSNVLILFHRNNGEWSSNSVEWRAQSLDFNAMSYNYRDYEAFDVTVPNTMTPKTIRPDIIMKADGQHGSLVNQVEFDSLYVPAGTYYAVFSSTDDAFTVEMTTDSVPLPEPAVIAYPSQGETYVTTPYQAKWIIGQYTNEIQVLFGAQNPPTTVLLDWTDQLVNHCSLPDMLHNQGYYLQVNERNVSGVTNSAVTAFSSYLDPPVDLHAIGSTVILEGEEVQLAWSAPNSNRAFLHYNIYQDNVCIGDTTATQYTVSSLSYTGNPIVFNVTAVYDEGESYKSNNLNVCVNGTGTVAGHVYEQDGITPIANATVTIYGVDHFYNDYGTSFVTGADGSYGGTVLVGYYHVKATAPGYSETTSPNVFSVYYGACTEGVDLIMDEYFYPPTQVAANYYPNPDNYESDTVQVTWAAPSGDRSLQYYRVYRTTYDNDGPYNSINTLKIADNVTDMEVIDSTFGDLEDGVYKYGVSCVYAGNRADEPEPILDENFDNVGTGLPTGWSLIDADGDGFNWILGSAVGGVYFGLDVSLAGDGHNKSADMMVSGSYSNCFSQALAPDNYLVTPQVELGGIFSFWACAQDYNYPEDHFGVAVSTSGNENPSDFTTIQEWTMSAKGIGAPSKHTRGGSRGQGNWYHYYVDLSAYRGQMGYIAIRHFNCYDQFILDVDDVYYIIPQLYPGERESQIVWASADRGQWLYDAVSLTVTLNTDDSLEGTQVMLTQSPEQQELNKMDSTQLNFYLDETGTYTWDRFRKGSYGINITKPGYGTIVDSVNITNNTALVYEMVETIEKPTNLYVSRTGWATWDNVATGQRHYMETLLTLTDMTGDTIFSCTTNKNYMQLPTASLTDGALYQCSVANCYSSGVGQVTQMWLYQSCDHFEGTTEQMGIIDTTGTGIYLSWTYPEPDTTGTRTVNNDGTWYYYDNGTLDDHIGKPGGTFYWGIMIPAGSYDGNLITSVIAYDIEPMTGTLTIYNDGETAPADSLAQFNVTFTGADEFVTIGMNPVEINPNKNIWLVFYNASGANYPAAASYDTGDPNGRWLNENEDGKTWADILSYPYGFHVTWMIRAQIVSTVPTPVGDYLGAAVFRDGEWIGFTAGTTFVDSEGTSDNEYTLRVVYDGDSIRPNANAYFAMSCPQTVPLSMPQFEVTATANPTAGGTIAGAGNYEYDTTCTLTATPATGYHFVNWTVNGTEVTTEATFSFTVTQDSTFVANFELNSYAIAATANPTAGGTIAGAGSYDYGQTATLTATPSTGYHFVNWTQGATEVTTEASFSFTVTQDSTFVANFELNTYAITATANPTAGGEVSGAGTYDHGATAILTATVNEGYTFISWTQGNEVVSNSPTYTFTVTEAGDYVANFELNSYDITATANPTAGGTVTGAGTYDYGTTCTFIRFRMFVRNAAHLWCV